MAAPKIKPHILIVEARFYEEIADELVKGAQAVLKKAGVTYDRLTVPGAFEIPAAIRMALRAMHFHPHRRRYDGYVALGCVIRGETTHYDYICSESARGLQDLALEFTLALGYGILTVENEAQALERARMDRKDKGGDAARACLAMIEAKRQFGLFPRT
jgi:6,7-dimethyl-8-ribityllumazine synthase